MDLLNIIFPKKCINCKKFGDFLCASCFSYISFNDKFNCPECFRPTPSGITHPVCNKKLKIDGIMPVVKYGPIIKKMVYQMKYEPYLSKLTEVAGELMADGLSQNESFNDYLNNRPVVIPVPLSSNRFRRRGYNHAELLGSYVAQYFNLKINTKILIRVKDTKPQYKLGRKARLANISGAFQVNNQTKMPSSIILVDDVATTYSTLKEAAKVLKNAGVRCVLGVTLAKEV